MHSRHDPAPTASARKKSASKAAPPARNIRKKAPAKVAFVRPDGLRPGSKMATMLDMVLTPRGATEAEICAAIGWKKCRVTLQRTAKKAGAELGSSINDKGDRVWKAVMPEKS